MADYYGRLKLRVGLGLAKIVPVLTPLHITHPLVELARNYPLAFQMHPSSRCVVIGDFVYIVVSNDDFELPVDLITRVEVGDFIEFLIPFSCIPDLRKGMKICLCHEKGYINNPHEFGIYALQFWERGGFTKMEIHFADVPSSSVTYEAYTGRELYGLNEIVRYFNGCATLCAERPPINLTYSFGVIATSEEFSLKWEVGQVTANNVAGHAVIYNNLEQARNRGIEVTLSTK